MIARRYNPTISPHFRRIRNISLHGRSVSAPTNAKRQPDKLKLEFQLTLLMIWGREMSRATMAVKMISGIMYIPLYTTL